MPADSDDHRPGHRPAKHDGHVEPGPACKMIGDPATQGRPGPCPERGVLVQELLEVRAFDPGLLERLLDLLLGLRGKELPPAVIVAVQDDRGDCRPRAGRPDVTLEDGVVGFER